MSRLRHPADEEGFTLAEMLVVLVILGIIITALAQLLVAGLNSETDQNARARAQNDVRLALDKLRREIHCGTSVSPNPSGTWPTRAITIVLPSYCATNSSGAVSVTWCTTGAGPYKLWRYPHATDLSAGSYATACTGTGTQFANDIVNAGSVTSGQIFSSPVTPTLPSLDSPDLTYGATSGSLGSSSVDTTYGYIVDPVVSGTEQPGTENIITLRAGVTGKSLLVDWSLACGAYASSASITAFKVYGRTANGEGLLQTVTSTGCATTSWTDSGSGTPSGSPVGPTRSKLTMTIPVRSNSTRGLITVQDDVTLRNTPR